MGLVNIQNIEGNIVRIYARTADGVRGSILIYSDQDYGVGSGGTDATVPFFVLRRGFTSEGYFTETLPKAGRYVVILNDELIGLVDYQYFEIKSGTIPPPPAEQKYKLVFQFSGTLSTTLSNAATEILHIMSDIIARMTGGYVGTPYYEGSDKMVFMVGTMGAGGIEGFIASSPKFTSLMQWFARLLGVVYVSSYIAEVITGITTAITTTATDATVDKCLSSNLSEEAKADCVRRALDLGKGTNWGTVVMLLGGLAVVAYFLKDVIGGKK